MAKFSDYVRLVNFGSAESGIPRHEPKHASVATKIKPVTPTDDFLMLMDAI